MRTVVTFGNFDGVHAGHIAIFSVVSDFSRRFSLPSVVVTFDPHPVLYFSKKDDFLIYSAKEKKLLIEQFADEVYVLEFDKKLAGLTPEEFLKFLHNEFNPAYIVTGPKCRFGNCASGNANDLKKYEEKFQYKTIIANPFDKNGTLYSSTLVRNFLKQGQTQNASSILGRKYSICGIIQKNIGLGTKIGFPTININIPKELIKPRLGVYCGEVKIDNVFYKGIINIGKRPTISQDNKISLEMHIFNFDRDIYDKEVKIFLSYFIRDEKKFSSVANLKKQINADIEFIQQQNH